MNYADDLKQTLMKNSTNEVKTLGIIFDGDGDRIAAIDEKEDTLVLKIYSHTLLAIWAKLKIILIQF